jgi:TonB family protein
MFVLIAAAVGGCRTAAPVPDLLPLPGDSGALALDTLIGGSRVYLAREVDRPAAIIPGGAFPRYPAGMKSSSIEGQVKVGFVIDTTGAIELATIYLVSSSHPGFLETVRNVLPKLRFEPAMRRGQRVRMWGTQAFEFRLGGFCLTRPCPTPTNPPPP